MNLMIVRFETVYYTALQVPIADHFVVNLRYGFIFPSRFAHFQDVLNNI